MKLKICGMKFPENIEAISALNPDYLGFIFYENSPRFFEEIEIYCSSEIQKVGVFVNENPEVMSHKIQKFNLDIIQLHGNETPEISEKMKQLNPNIKIWKAFSIGNDFDFEQLDKYQNVEAYLFDTKGKNYGGNGVKFNWEILKNYKSEKEIILSGGISVDDVPLIYELQKKIPQIQTIDVNSRFETGPGRKDVERLRVFYEKLKELR